MRSDVVNFNSLFVVKDFSGLVFRFPLFHDEALADPGFRERRETDAVRLLLARDDSPLVLLRGLGVPDCLPFVFLCPVQPSDKLFFRIHRGEVNATDVVLVVLPLSDFAAAGIFLLEWIGRPLSFRLLWNNWLEEVRVMVFRTGSAPLYDNWREGLERQVVAHCNSDKSLPRGRRLFEKRLERVELLAGDVQVRVLLRLVLHYRSVKILLSRKRRKRIYILDGNISLRRENRFRVALLPGVPGPWPCPFLSGGRCEARRRLPGTDWPCRRQPART